MGLTLLSGCTRAHTVIPHLLVFSLIQNMCMMPLLRAWSYFRQWGHLEVGVSEQRSGLCMLTAVVVVACKAAGDPEKSRLEVGRWWLSRVLGRGREAVCWA